MVEYNERKWRTQPGGRQRIAWGQCIRIALFMNIWVVNGSTLVTST
jgi:hypothetical protein